MFWIVFFSPIRYSVKFSSSVVSDSLQPHELQHARPPCPSPTPGVHSFSHPSSRWCHPAISSSVIPFSSCPQSLPGSGSFPVSQLFTWGGQSIGVSALASDFPVNIGVTGKFGLGIRSEAGQRLIEFFREHTGHSKHPLATIQEKTLHMDITRWSTPNSDWLYSLQPKMEKLYTVNKNKPGSWLWLRSWTPYWQIQTENEESRENH